jgi:hypothetical protein
MAKWFKYYSASKLVTRLLRYVKISVERDPIQFEGERQQSRVTIELDPLAARVIP